MVSPVDEGARMYVSVQDVSARIDVAQYPKMSLETAIRAATARCEGYTNRVFTRVPAGTGTQTRHFLGGGSPILTIDDALSIAAISVDGVSVSLLTVLQMPMGKTPITWLEYKDGTVWAARADVTVVGAWGYSETVPWDIWDSVCVLVVRAIAQVKAGYQDASAIPELGELVYALALPRGVRETWNNLRELPF